MAFMCVVFPIDNSTKTHIHTNRQNVESSFKLMQFMSVLFVISKGKIGHVMHTRTDTKRPPPPKKWNKVSLYL